MSIPLKTSSAFVPSQRIVLSGNLLVYRQAGNGFPLLLLHGWRGSSRYWQDTLERFANQHTMYALDLPGHGESPPMADPASAERTAALVIECADKLGLKQFDINGHSLGAAVAVYVAARWPKRVRKLVLTSLGTFRNDLERFMIGQAYYQWRVAMQVWRPYLELWRPWLTMCQPWVDWLGSQPSVYNNLVSNFVHQVPSDELVVREGVLEFLRTDQINALDGAISAADPAFTTLLRKVVAPTLLISADQDKIMPPSGVQALARLIPDCQMVQIKRCGHLPMIEHPDLYHDLVGAFLAARDASQGAVASA